MSILNTAADHIRECVAELGALSPSHRDPERFHSDKSDLVYRLNGIANVLEGKVTMPEREPEPKPAFKPGKITRRDGNVIRAEFRAPRRVKKDGTPGR